LSYGISRFFTFLFFILKISRIRPCEYNKRCSIFHHESNKIGFAFLLNSLRFYKDFTRFSKRLNTISEHTFKQAPRIFQRVTYIPLLRRWTPGKIWGLAIGSLGTGRRRSGQNPASRWPGPAGRWREKVLRVLGVRFLCLVGAGRGPARGAPAPSGGGRRDCCTGDGGSMQGTRDVW
jgi:hypothetical protein